MSSNSILARNIVHKVSWKWHQSFAESEKWKENQLSIEESTLIGSKGEGTFGPRDLVVLPISFSSSISHCSRRSKMSSSLKKKKKI